MNLDDIEGTDHWDYLHLVASKHGPADPTTRHVLHVIGLHYKPANGMSWPTQEQLAERTGLTVRTVNTHVVKAEKTGWLKISKWWKKGQGWNNDQYTPAIPDDVLEFRKSKPWHDDPTWARQENASGRTAKPKRRRQETASCRNAPVTHRSVTERQEIHAERQEIYAEGQENNDMTTGTKRQNDTKHVPTNSTSNSTSNSTVNSTTKVESQNATATSANVQRDPVAGSKADRLDSAADMMRRLPNMPIINVALRFQLSSDEVLQLRKLQ